MKKIELPIEEFTSPIDFTLAPSDKLEEVISKVEGIGYRHYPVLDKGDVVGMLSQRDLAVYQGASAGKDNLCVSDVMSEDVLSVIKGSSMEETVFLMSERKVGSAIVTENNGEPYGIFTSIDALNALVEILRGEV